ncbi:MAG: YdcF family protein [Bacillota bacterium]|nr:YdcF family protein [Bacillota bacterium]
MKKNRIIINFLRVVFFCLTGALLALYIYPFSINYGGLANLIGIAICLAIMTLIAFWSKCKRLYLNIRKNKKGEIFENIIAVILCILILWGIIGTGLMIYGANVKPAENATAIVLGFKVDASHPSQMLKERLDTAVDYLNSNPNSKCVVSGGLDSDNAITEAQCMYDYLIAHRISSERLYIENQATNTDENIIFSYNIIKNCGLNKNVAIISDGFHEFRALYIAKRIDIQSAGAVSSKTPLKFLPEFHIRELLAIVNEVFTNIK